MRIELSEPLNRLDREWADLEAVTGALSAEQVGFQPDDGWSIHEVVDHMQRVEGAFLRMMRQSGDRGPRRRGWLRSLGLVLVRLVMKWGVRVRIPRGVDAMRPTAERPIAELFAEARAGRADARQSFANLGADDLSRSAAKHPIGGPLDFREAIWFTESHFRHHLRQIARVRAHPDFPA